MAYLVRVALLVSQTGFEPASLRFEALSFSPILPLGHFGLELHPVHT